MSTFMSQTNGEVLVVYFSETRILDDGKIQQLGEELVKFVDKTEHAKLLVNFQNVRFMCSAMLGKLMVLNKKCKAANVSLKLCNISKDIMEVFRLTNLNKILEIHADEADALAAFSKRGWFL
jgi:anti-sigma B factor antagonist